jgi:transcription termination factor Rho
MLPRSALEESPLADLHVLAAEMGIDGYRRLRKADLIDRIVGAQGGDDGTVVEEDGVTDEDAGTDAPEGEADADAEERPARRRGRRGGRGRSRDADADADAGDDTASDEADTDDEDEPEARPARSRRRTPAAKEERGDDADRVASGTVELLGNGSGFLRVSPPDPSDDDVYISAAQVRRCELVSGDEVSGPVRAPRRSERYPSLVRVDTINGKPADEVAEGTHFDDLPCEFPSERFALGADDPTLKAIEWLTPFGRGSRVSLVGEARSGKSEALRRLAVALKGQEAVDQLTVVLVGVRPEEIGLWKEADIEAVASLGLSASSDAQAQAAERAVETARRVAARGGHAVVVVDTLDGLHVPAARRVLAAARNITGGGSLTIVATSAKPVGGETTVIAFDRELTATGRFPALDLGASGTLRPELLVGQAGADAIAQARAAAIG